MIYIYIWFILYQNIAIRLHSKTLSITSGLLLAQIGRERSCFAFSEYTWAYRALLGWALSSVTVVLPLLDSASFSAGVSRQGRCSFTRDIFSFDSRILMQSEDC